MKGSTYKRCKCRDDNGKELGQSCPKIRRKNGTWNPRHGAWYFRLEVEAGKNGTRRTVRRGGFTSQDDAQRALDEAKVKHGRGHDVSKLLFRDFFDGWLAGNRKLTESTRIAYASHGRLYLKPHLGHIELDRLGIRHVVAMFDAIEADNAQIRAAQDSTDPQVRESVKGQRVTGPATQQRIRATLRSCLSAAVRDPKLPVTVNVAKLVDLETGKRPKPVLWTQERTDQWQAEYATALDQARNRPWGKNIVGFKLWEGMERPSPVMVYTPDQTGLFLDHAADHRLYAAFHVVAFQGLRRGEACGLRWVDVDLTGGTLTVRRQRRQLGWVVDEADTKTEGSEGTVHFDAGTVEVLKAHRARQNEERLAWGEAWEGVGHVFVQENGAPLHPATLTDEFLRLAFDAGLPPIRLHDLRHGAATIALAAGVDMKVVQAMLRHSSITITADTYTSVVPEVAKRAAEASAAVVPRRRAVGDTPRTPGLPTGSHGLRNGEGRPSNMRNAQLMKGEPPGARTRNPRIKSPLLCRLS